MDVEEKKENDSEFLEEEKEFGFIVIFMGEGLVNIFKDFGVDYIIEGG